MIIFIVPDKICEIKGWLLILGFCMEITTSVLSDTITIIIKETVQFTFGCEARVRTKDD